MFCGGVGVGVDAVFGVVGVWWWRGYYYGVWDVGWVVVFLGCV